MKRLVVILCVALFAALPARAAEVPPWFVETFLELRDDVKEAAASGRRLMLYFGQDGCPYCRLLLETNFTQKRIADKARRALLPVALNMWGDRPVTWLDGRRMSEKDLAAFLKVQYTPTLLFFDESGTVILRLNGYYPPHRLEPAIDYVTGRLEKKQAFADYMRTAVKEEASAQLGDQPYFRKTTDLSRKPGGKPLALVFETRHCAGCDELHKDGWPRPDVRAAAQRFDVVRLALSDQTEIVAPDGKRTDVARFARELGVAYTPSIVFFEAGGREVFRVEAYVRAFHLASAMEYVASGAYRQQPSFQRFLQARAEKRRAQGEKVELMQ